MHNDLAAELTATLQTQFGFTAFRPGQQETIVSLLTKNRLLCIKPTGYGKSLLYQLPAVLLDGITLVISPLLALMRDQLAQLQERFAIRAGSFNTDQSVAENDVVKQAVMAGDLRILFIAPEQLDQLQRFELLLSLPISLLVVDEAHCISTWGHDFRPSYRQIIRLVHALTKKNTDLKLLALTATANQKTEADIKQQLTIDHYPIIVHRENMNRPNIRLTVIPNNGIPEKLATLIELLTTLTGCGLIYCATRENTELVADFLLSQHIHAAAYHAGFPVEQKRHIQCDFIADKYKVIAATNALGMGIDKSNLRFIIHFDFPGSITAYYQEVGRAGRDGLPADGILLYDANDRNVQRYFIDAAQPSLEDFKHIIQLIANAESPLTLTTIKRLSGLHTTKISVIIAELVEQAFLQKSISQYTQIYQLTNKTGLPTLDRYHTQQHTKHHELLNMQHYAEQKQRCLMAILRNALGDSTKESCGKCGRCVKPLFLATSNKELILAITAWLENRVTPIILAQKTAHIAIGCAVLNSKQHPVIFAQFMRERAQALDNDFGIPEALLPLIKTCLMDLAKRHHFSCIVAVPSRSWAAQEKILDYISRYLRIPTLVHTLTWISPPVARQGELLNNEQRQHNVTQRMQAVIPRKIPKGAILLLDDYIGSGATLYEAARALRQHGLTHNKIVPFTIAQVKWRTGKRGMI